jgi:hypothetical protein
MRILELEKLFQSEDTLDKVFDELSEDMQLIDNWAIARKENLTDNIGEIDKALNQLSGAYSNLRTALGIADTEKDNRQVRFKEGIRIAIEANVDSKEKYVDTKAETQASAHVAPYRRVLNLINGYVEACDKQINTLQTIKRTFEKDYKNTNQKTENQ